ncbi:DUF3558 domain-containing protein [Nocardia sp. NPDC050799]|uniref:DUF3558 domain-containing protein n=1 Tax=Nocardia sp. NPDC050799 TaxID=3154842 RepID=UPI0033CBD00D
MGNNRTEGGALRLRVVLSAIALLLTAGCGTTESAGTSVSATEAVTEPFNVCQDLPDAALTAAGLDSTTKDVLTDPPSGPSSWRVCAWDPLGMSPVTYVVELYSTSHTMDETQKNENLIDFTEVDIAGREGITFREKNTAETRCRAAFGAEQGSFIVSTAWMETGDKPADLCGLAVQYLSDLEPALPD